MRIIVVSDMHYGYAVWRNPIKHTELGLLDADRVSLAVSEINKLNPDLVLVNGDSIDGLSSVSSFTLVKEILDGFKSPYYVSKGNHDCISYNDFYTTVFDMNVTHDSNEIYHFEYKGYGFVCIDVFQTVITGNWGEVQIDETLLGSVLDSLNNTKGIFVYSHWITAESTRSLICNHQNVKAVYFGHDHLKAHTITGHNVSIEVEQHFSFSGYGHSTNIWFTYYNPWAFKVVDIDSEGNITSNMHEVIHYAPRQIVPRQNR